MAAADGKADCVAVLVDMGANREATDEVRNPHHARQQLRESMTLLPWLVFLPVVSSLRIIPAFLWQDGDTPLHAAATNAQLACIETLIAKGANKDAQNLALQTPMHEAAAEGHVACVQRLVALGANKELTDHVSSCPDKHTPFFNRSAL